MGFHKCIVPCVQGYSFYELEHISIHDIRTYCIWKRFFKTNAFSENVTLKYFIYFISNPLLSLTRYFSPEMKVVKYFILNIIYKMVQYETVIIFTFLSGVLVLSILISLCGNIAMWNIAIYYSATSYLIMPHFVCLLCPCFCINKNTQQQVKKGTTRQPNIGSYLVD